MGRLARPARTPESLIQENDPSQLQRLQESQGLNYQVLAWAQAHALWCLGRLDAAPRGRVQRAASARELGQPFSQAIAATYRALLQQLRAHPAEFRREAKEALDLATEFKAVYYRAWPPSSSPTAIRLIARRRRARAFCVAPSRASSRRGEAPPAFTRRSFADAHLRPARPKLASWSSRRPCLSAGR